MEEDLGRLEAANELRIRSSEQQWEFVIPASFSTRMPAGAGADGASGLLQSLVGTLNRFFSVRGGAAAGGSNGSSNGAGGGSSGVRGGSQGRQELVAELLPADYRTDLTLNDIISEASALDVSNSNSSSTSSSSSSGRAAGAGSDSSAAASSREPLQEQQRQQQQDQTQLPGLVSPQPAAADGSNGSSSSSSRQPGSSDSSSSDSSSSDSRALQQAGRLVDRQRWQRSGRAAGLKQRPVRPTSGGTWE
jgi:hypothetical protein